MACSNSCSFEAISFPFDEEGFWYPKVDTEKCRNCGKCERVCPFNDEMHGVPAANRSAEPRFFAAQLKERAELFEVSSGGAFQAIARSVIRDQGIVYGAAQKDVDHIFHIRAENLEELKLTKRSKYLQSDIGDCYRRALRDLKNGKTVLFSGTGCQIAGLNCFLDKEYQNLYTCEVVCHGVPSRKVWEQYRKEKEAQTGKKLTDLVFRDKSLGWKKNQYKITYEDRSVEYERITTQLFHAGYLQGLFYRPSCGACPFASMPRAADLTLADYWRYQGRMAEEDVGVSLVSANNPHGLTLLEKARDLLNIESTSAKDALNSCRHMDDHPTENPDRNAFIQETLSAGFHHAAKKYYQNTNSLPSRIKNKLRRIMRSSIK